MTLTYFLAQVSIKDHHFIMLKFNQSNGCGILDVNTVLCKPKQQESFKIRCSDVHVIFEQQSEKTYLLTSAPMENLNQHAHPRRPIGVFVVRMKTLYIPMCQVKIVIRLRDCESWSETWLGAHVQRYIF